MIPFMVRANSASELVRKVMTALAEDDNMDRWEANSPRGMPIREFRHCWYRLEDTSRCAAWLPTRKLNYAFMVAEFLWIFCGRDDLEMIGTYCKEIGKFSDDGRTFFGAYGPRWRGQIGAVVENLKRDPDSRQGVVSIWRPEALTACEYPDPPYPSVPSKDVPCTLSMQYLIRNGKLEAGVVMRSSDAWLGLPYDIFNFSMLQRAVASELGIPAGSLTMYLGSSHLYERNLEQARKVVDQEMEYYIRHGTHPASHCVIERPPGIAYESIMQSEETIRSGGRIFVDWRNWGPLLGILSTHVNGDRKDLVAPWDLLMEEV